MSHVFKSGSSVFTTGGSVIKVKDSITLSKQPINIGFNYPQFIEVDTTTGRYYIASTNVIKIFDVDFHLLDTVN
ncbi:hypothetical protein QN344_00180, partial [Mucilaginibacter sp. 5B2]|nr:hypothetical protein [Mucilaginibacter sp. 5B2]